MSYCVSHGLCCYVFNGMDLQYPSTKKVVKIKHYYGGIWGHAISKDKVMFLTEEDLKGPSSVVLPEIEQPKGALLPNGEINWSCPCLGNAPIGPCSVEFRESLSCFHKSQSESKGSECMKEYFAMTDCFAKYPELYKRNDKDSQSLEAEKEVLNSLDEDEELSKTTISKSDVSSK